MDNDLAAFFIGIGVLVLYLIISAKTEMGTKLPWGGDRDFGDDD
jgi:hypothetical protein